MYWQSVLKNQPEDVFSIGTFRVAANRIVDFVVVSIVVVVGDVLSAAMLEVELPADVVVMATDKPQSRNKRQPAIQVLNFDSWHWREKQHNEY